MTDLRVRASHVDVEAAWRAVKGQGSGISWHYLRILAGVDDVKADRMVVAFVGRAAECSVTPASAQQMLKAAYATLLHDYPALTLRGLDHAVWSAERITRRRRPRGAV